MLEKLNSLMLGGYYRAKNFVRKLKNDELGLSGVVVAVLLILVAVLAVVLLWGLLKDWLVELWGRITGNASGLS